jgi:hypothetical protein
MEMDAAQEMQGSGEMFAGLQPHHATARLVGKVDGGLDEGSGRGGLRFYRDHIEICISKKKQKTSVILFYLYYAGLYCRSGEFPRETRRHMRISRKLS